ncbi:MAG: hypothetical protein ACPGDB_00625 [Fusobacterium sp.]
MKEKLSLLSKQAKEEIFNLKELQELENFRVKYLGKKGQLTEISKGMKNLTKEEKPVIGQALNIVRQEITTLIETKKVEIMEMLTEKKLKVLSKLKLMTK